MPDATFLHIQTRHSATSQVLELTGVSIRVGHGPQCEVRLDDASLAEVQCVLRRRGSAWFIQPAGPSELVSIAGIPVERQRPWPPGAVLRVGSHWLSLRTHTQAKTATLGSFERPIEGTLFSAAAAELRHRAAKEPTPAPELPDRARSAPGLTPTSTPTPSWSEAFEGHRRFLRDRKRERPRQSKWRSVGETLRAQFSARRPDTPTAPTQPADRPSAVAVFDQDKADAPRFFLPGPISTPTPSPIPSPIPIRPDESEAAPIAPSQVSEAAPIEWPVGADPMVAFAAPEQAINPTEDTAWAEPGFFPIVLEDPEPETETEPEPEPGPVLDSDPDPGPETGHALNWSAIEADDFDEAAGFVETPETDASEPVLPLAEHRDDDREHPREVEPDGQPTAAAAPPEVPPYQPASGIEPPPWPGTVRFVADTSQGHAWRELARPDRPTSRPIRERRESLELPSVLDILQQHSTRCEPRRAQPSPRPERITRPALPTASQPPRLLRLPRRLVIAPALLATLLLSAVALRLSWEWMWDDRAAAIASNHLLAFETLPRKPIPPPERSGSSWWRTTAPHLMLHAMLVNRGQDDPARVEEVRGLLDAARSAAPLDPVVRLAGIGPGIAHLGLSRDVIALHETGRRSLEEGRKAAALKAYNAALELIARADPERAPIPPFFEDAQTRRFGMPNETLMGSLLRDLIVTGPDREALTFEEWSSSLPRSAVVLLAAYRICLDQNSPDADRVFALITENVGRQPAELATPIDNAAAAEALALKGRFDEASERYQAALDAKPNGPIRRTWALNLAEIEGRLGHRREMDEAWDATRGHDPDDPINRRLVEARQRHGNGNGNAYGAGSTAEAATRDNQLQRATYSQGP